MVFWMSTFFITSKHLAALSFLLICSFVVNVDYPLHIYVQDCSCCTVVAENFALTSPQILAGQGFSRILVFTAEF